MDDVTREFCEARGLPADLGPETWRDLDPVLVPLRCLLPTQRPAVWPCGRIRKRLGEPPRSGDPYPYVLMAQGAAWIYDGHHRIAEDLANGIEWGEVKLAWWNGTHDGNTSRAGSAESDTAARHRTIITTARMQPMASVNPAS